MDNASRLDRLAVKTGVSLGLLPPDERDAVLAWAAIHMPALDALDERSVNGVLQAFLREGGSMLRTDHVELRRWLVDGRWLDRDGFGRAYRLAAGAPERASVLLGDASAERLDARIASRQAAEAAERRLRRERHGATA